MAGYSRKAFIKDVPLPRYPSKHLSVYRIQCDSEAVRRSPGAVRRSVRRSQGAVRRSVRGQFDAVRGQSGGSPARSGALIKFAHSKVFILHQDGFCSAELVIWIRLKERIEDATEI